MALSSIFGRQNSLWDAPVVVTLFDDAAPTAASSFARDAHAVASTSVDWKETATEHVFKADLPGLRKEDVRVEVDEHRTLSISGQRKREEVQKTDTWHRVERSSGQFMRKFRLPENANLDAITAKVDSGVLTVVVPKVEKKKTQTRSIAIAGQEGTTPAITHDVKNPVEAAAAAPEL